MPDGPGDSVTTQIQQTEAEAGEIIDEARRRLSDLDAHHADPLIDYDATISELQADIQQATDGLRLGTEELEEVQECTRVLRRVNTALYAQLTACRRTTEQRLEYLDDRVTDLREFAISLSDGTTPDEDQEAKLAPLTDWIQKARQYIEADRHTELVAADGAHTLSDLKARIEETDAKIGESAPESAEVDYLRDLCESEVEYLDRVIDRLERVEPTQDRFSTEGFRSEVTATTSVESLAEWLDEIRTQRRDAVEYADVATETAMTLDALQEEGFEHTEMEQLHEEATENLRRGNIDTARRQTGKLIKWETELTPVERFELALSERDGELLKVVERTGFSMDSALEHVSELHDRDAVEDIVVTLK